MRQTRTHGNTGYFARARRAGGYFAAAALLIFPAVLRAGDNPPPTSRPFLDELNRETQVLFNQASPSVVRLQLPIASFAMDDELLNKWSDRLDPEVRRRLEELENRGPAEGLVREDIVPTTLPSNPGGDTTAPSVIEMQLRSFAPNSVGLVIDDQRHVLVPQFLDSSQFSAPAVVLLPDGSLTTASLVGSDRPTQLSLLQLQSGDVKAASIASDDLMAGSLLMVLSLNPAFNRLSVWQGVAPEPSVLVNLDGGIVGFCGSRGFISTERIGPVVQELIEHGQVRRALLGVGVRAVGPDDPQRAKDPALGQTPALRIELVIAGSAAEKAGIRPGDLILELAGQTVGNVRDIATAIIGRQGPTPLVIFRDGQQLTVTADLQIQ